MTCIESLAADTPVIDRFLEGERTLTMVSKMKKTRLAVVSPKAPWREGGIERTVGEIVKRLREDFNIMIYCTGDEEDAYNWEGVPVYVFRGYTTAYNFSLSMYNALKKAEFDIIHTHGFARFMPLATSLVKKDRKLVFSPYFHTIGSKLIYTILRKIYDPIIGHYLFRKTDLIVCFSNTEKFFISNLFRVPSSKVKVVYNGVNIDEIKQAKPYDLRQKIMLYVGRLEKYKNVQLIIKSLPYLPEEYQLYIIGRGDYEASLKMMVNKLNLKDRVKFLGYLMDRDMYRWLKTCSVFLQLSEIESGISITCIEALTAGKPVIANDGIMSLKETVDLFKGKGVYPFNTKRSSTYELVRLVEDISSVRVDVDLSNFDWNTTAKEFRDLYLEVLNGKTQQVNNTFLYSSLTNSLSI